MRWSQTVILEKVVETADVPDDADRQGLQVKRQRTCEVTPKPGMDSVVQPLHLRNLRNLRLNELPVLGSSFKAGSRFKLETENFELRNGSTASRPLLVEPLET